MVNQMNDLILDEIYQTEIGNLENNLSTQNSKNLKSLTLIKISNDFITDDFLNYECNFLKI
jgi:hypothetical protein